MLLVALLVISACSRTPEKEIITVPTIVETPELEKPTIQIVPRPDPVIMKDADIVVVTESNLEEVIERIKGTQGEFVLYALTWANIPYFLRFFVASPSISKPGRAFLGKFISTENLSFVSL